jgi:hypothetical protein
MPDLTWKATASPGFAHGLTLYVLFVDDNHVGHVTLSIAGWEDFAARLGLVEGKGGVWSSMGKAVLHQVVSTSKTGPSLSDALPACLFRYCPTLDKCKADGCSTPWSKGSRKSRK